MDLIKSLGLQEEWEKLFKAVGVESFEELAKAGKKDKTKLIPVKKQITRGGKTVETTVWVSPKEAEDMKKPKKQEEPTKEKAKKKEEPAKEPKKKKEEPAKKKAKPKAEPKKEKKPETDLGVIAPHDDAKLKELHGQLDGWKDKEVAEALKEASQDHYLVTAHANGKVVGIGAFKRKGKVLHMEHFGSAKEVPGVGKQLVQHLMEKANEMDLGISIKPPKASSQALQEMGLKDDYSGVLSMDAEGVKSALKAKEKPEKKESKEDEANKLKDSENKKLSKELRKVRKQIGSDQYRELLEHHGIKWTKADHQGVNTMRATMAAAEFVKKGGKLDVKGFLKAKAEAEKEAERKTKEEEAKKAEAEKKAQEEAKKREEQEKKEKAEREKEMKKAHDLDFDAFPVEFKEARGKERLFVAGQVKGTMNMTPEDRKLIEELAKVKNQDEFTKLYHKAEDDGKLNEFTSGIFSMLNNLYKLKSTLFKVDGYRVGMGRDKTEELGKTINSDTKELSPEEGMAIRGYTGSMSTAINNFFRKGPDNVLDNKHTFEQAQLIDGVLKRNELTENVMVYRGAGYPAIGGQMAKDILAGDFDKYIGAEITDKGFMSTSLGATSMFHGDVTFQIMAPKGTKGKYLEGISSTPGEYEVLMPRGTTMKVNKITVEGSKIQILAEVIGHGKGN